MSRWLFWTMVTIITWGMWAVLSNLLSKEIESPAHSQVASTLGILPVVVMLWWMKDPPTVGNHRRGLLIALGSGIVSSLGNIAFFDLFHRGAKAAAAIPITALSPAVTVLLAIPILHERLSLAQWIGISLSFVAIYFFNVPGEEGFFSAWLLFALVPTALWGVCGLMQKMSTNHVSARTSAIWFLLAFIPVAVLIVIVDPLSGAIPIRAWLLAAAVGFTLALGNLTILLAFSNGGKASIISPLASLYFLVSIPIAMIWLDEPVDRRDLFGIACALAAVVMISYQSQPEPQPAPTLETDVAP
jgi:drug/metabolite transporter (DMT)-like permease